MTTAELAVKIRGWLRISTSAANEEIEQCIKACQIDLIAAGVDVVSLDDSLTQQAIKEYCKSRFGFEAEAERYAAAYERTKITMAMSARYTEGINSREVV